MLVEFSVENHRAFREKQTFSMVADAATQRLRPDHVARTGFSAVPYVLREACLFGANGSGKSSLIDAITFMSRFVQNSFRNEPRKGIDVKPFLFHSEWRNKPSEFEAIFIQEETQYQYGFALTRERVVEEWLFARPKITGRQRRLFTRTYDHATGGYDWDISNSNLKGERESWKEQTREDALFLSTAVQLKSEDLKEAFEWFNNQLKFLETTKSIPSNTYTISRLHEEGWSNRVIEFLNCTDIMLLDIDIDERNFFESNTFLELPPEAQKVMREGIPEDAKQRIIHTVRLDESGNRVPLNLNEESSGTVSLFQLAGPILDVLDNGYVLVVDELNSGLHPLAFQNLITMFCNPNLNTKNAQLIFTSHDTSMLNSECIGKGQIWFVEKGNDLAARLKPLSDYNVRRDTLGFQKGYLQGRYGAIPRILG